MIREPVRADRFPPRRDRAAVHLRSAVPPAVGVASVRIAETALLLAQRYARVLCDLREGRAAVYREVSQPLRRDPRGLPAEVVGAVDEAEREQLISISAGGALLQ